MQVICENCKIAMHWSARRGRRLKESACPKCKGPLKLAGLAPHPDGYYAVRGTTEPAYPHVNLVAHESAAGIKSYYERRAS